MFIRAAFGLMMGSDMNDKQHTLARLVGAAALALAREWRIVYAAFDFLIRAGEAVFLEANMAGDWRWLETGMRPAPVTEAAVRMIRARHAVETAVEVVTFLAGGDGDRCG